MSRKKVVTKNKKVYYISEYSSKYTVYRLDDVGFLFNDEKNLGTTKTLDDALSIIKADSSSDIKSIN